MKKLFQRAGMGLAAVVGLLVLLVLISLINHRMQLAREDAFFNRPVGQLVEVNGHLMNVYAEGAGETTLVFLSGGGTSSPVLDFKSLYTLLSDDYRIAVVERAGYGFSEVAEASRDIDTVLAETRLALSLSGIEGPYVLCSHSLSGMEALYWAQQFPEEIQAIIGLDMAVPQAYAGYSNNMLLVRLGVFAARTGLIRWIPGVAESDAIRFGTLSEEEKALYRIIFYRRTATESMLLELQEARANAQIVGRGGVPSVPILLFSSNGQGTGWDEEAWQGFQKSYAQSDDKISLIELDVPHYVHDHEYGKIAKEIKSFLKDF